MEKKQQKNSSYMFRLVVGAYLIYLAVSLAMELIKGGAPLGPVTMICMPLFGIAGVLLVILSARQLYLSQKHGDNGGEE